MNDFVSLESIAVSAAIGLLIGIERGWQFRLRHDGQRVAGVRTFTLIGLAGGASGLLAKSASPVVLAACALSFSLIFGTFELRHMRITRDYSATDFVAGLLTFALGAYAVEGSTALAAAIAVVMALVLAERARLHEFLRRLTWMELRAALLLLLMSVVLLPILPDRMVDPWGVVNPHEIWLMTVLAAAVSFGGYVAMRLAGERRGLLYAAATGGLVTSTTVTWTFARLVRARPTMRGEVTAAILAAWVVSLIRMSAIAIMVAPSMAAGLLSPVLASATSLCVPLAIAYAVSDKVGEKALPISNPFELSLILRFCGILAVIFIGGRLLSERFGVQGLSALGAASGILDVDPITLSMARAVRGGMAVPTGVVVILLAALSNGITKSFLAFVFGGWRLGAILSACMLVAAAAGLAVVTLPI